jgi:hypothetical protein
VGYKKMMAGKEQYIEKRKIFSGYPYRFCLSSPRSGLAHKYKI